MVVYVIPEKTWYIIPSSALKGRRTLDLYSRNHKKQGLWAQYREAWDLFRQPGPCTCGRARAAAESSIPAPPLFPAPQPPDQVQL